MGWLWARRSGTLSSMMVATSGRPLTTLARSGMERNALSGRVLPAALLPTAFLRVEGLYQRDFFLVPPSASPPKFLVSAGGRHDT